MATSEETSAAWEAYEKASQEELEIAIEMAIQDELGKAVERLDVAADSEQGSPSTASILASFPIPPSGYPPLPSSSSSSSSSSDTTSSAGSNAAMDKNSDPNTILDRHEKAIADILKRFLNMVVAATEPIDEGYTPEKASLNQMQMETETAALVKAIENLLGLTREIRRLWMTGPLTTVATADQRDQARDAAIDAKTERICTLFNQWITLREENQRAARRRLAEKRQQGGGSDSDKDAEAGSESAAAAGAADHAARPAAAGGSAVTGSAADQAGGMA